jgi:hypothetical protein
MAESTPVWRKIGAVLAALVLTVLTFGPSLDTFLCGDEGAHAAPVAEMTVSKATAHQNGALDADGLGPCVHGHCHHATAYVPVMPEAAAAPDYIVSALDRPGRSRVPTSDPQFGLMRPPRA